MPPPSDSHRPGESRKEEPLPPHVVPHPPLLRPRPLHTVLFFIPAAEEEEEEERTIWASFPLPFLPHTCKEEGWRKKRHVLILAGVRPAKARFRQISILLPLSIALFRCRNMW